MQSSLKSSPRKINITFFPGFISEQAFIVEPCTYHRAESEASGGVHRRCMQQDP